MALTLIRAAKPCSAQGAAAVSYARAFIANPDFVARTVNGWPLASFDRRTLYTPGAAGYTSYPQIADRLDQNQPSFAPSHTSIFGRAAVRAVGTEVAGVESERLAA